MLGVVQDWDGQPLASGRRARLVLAPLYPGLDGVDVVGWAYELVAEQ